MTQFIIGLILIAFAAILAFYGQQLARDGLSKMSSDPSAVIENAATAPTKTKISSASSTNQAGVTAGTINGNVTINTPQKAAPIAKNIAQPITINAQSNTGIITQGQTGGSNTIITQNVRVGPQPRKIEETRKSELVKKLRDLGQHEFMIQVIPSTDEANSFANELFEALKKAGWTSPQPHPNDTNVTFGVSGLMISGRTAELQPELTNKLRRLFEDVGLPSSIHKPCNSFAPSETIVEIFVGPRD